MSKKNGGKTRSIYCDIWNADSYPENPTNYFVSVFRIALVLLKYLKNMREYQFGHFSCNTFLLLDELLRLVD